MPCAAFSSGAHSRGWKFTLKGMQKPKPHTYEVMGLIPRAVAAALCCTS